MRSIFISLLAAMILVACTIGMPKPNENGPVRTLGGGFILESGKLKYGMTYTAARNATPLYGKVEFENPTSKSAPMILSLGELNRSQDIVAQSPPFDSIRNNMNYSVTLYVYADAELTQLIDAHKDQVRFAMPPELIRQVGIRLL